MFEHAIGPFEIKKKKNVADSLFETKIELQGDNVLYNGDSGDCPLSGDSIQPHDLGYSHCMILSH